MRNMMRIPLSVACATAAAAAFVSGPAHADETYSCVGQNTALHFVIYEDGDTPRGGHMYINNIQVAVLEPRRINPISIRATVRGNTVDTEFVLNKSRRKIYIELRGTSREVCDARVREL